MKIKLSLLLLLIILIPNTVSAVSKVQKQGVKTLAECIAAGATGANCLVDTSQIWDTNNSQQLSTSITSGEFGGSKAYSINSQTGTTYTLALTDGFSNKNFPLLSASNASDQMVTVPPHSSVAFPVGEKVDLTQQGAGRVILVPGSGVTLNSADGNVLNKQYSFGTLIQTAQDIWTIVGQHLTGMIVATGGTITTDGDYKVHTFNSSGTFQVISGSGTVASLVVAGGGGAGGDTGTGSAGGGGAGGLTYTTPGATYIAGSYTVTVGGGGNGGNGGSGANGGSSVFDVVTTVGGGGGGGNAGAVAVNGISGGSGGGGNGRAGGGTGGAGTAGQGNAGGTGTSPGANAGGGGGGSFAIGGNGNGAGVRGNGGNGTSNSITGSAVTYAGGGGGGGGFNPGSGGLGGTGGGGNGDSTGGTGGSGTTNTGSGGGGGGIGGNGGSGVVIVRYKFQ